MDKSRRKALQTIGAFSIYFSQCKISAEERSAKYADAIRLNREKAESLLKEISCLGSEIDNLMAAKMYEHEAALRVELFQTLSDVNSNDLYLYILPEWKKLANAFINNKIPLLPEKDQIKIHAPTRKFENKECDDTTISVIVDIVLEGLDLQEAASAIKRVIKQTPSIQDNIDSLAQAIQLRDWEQAVDLVAKLMDKISDVGMVDLFVKALGEKGRTVWRRILSKLGARFVPFVGQVYTVITIAIALFDNSERLFHAIECSK